jgi:hypothetical protein
MFRFRLLSLALVDVSVFKAFLLYTGLLVFGANPGTLLHCGRLLNTSTRKNEPKVKLGEAKDCYRVWGAHAGVGVMGAMDTGERVAEKYWNAHVYKGVLGCCICVQKKTACCLKNFNQVGACLVAWHRTDSDTPSNIPVLPRGFVRTTLIRPDRPDPI